jgi:hypothetical protein
MSKGDRRAGSCQANIQDIVPTASTDGIDRRHRPTASTDGIDRRHRPGRGHGA